MINRANLLLVVFVQPEALVLVCTWAYVGAHNFVYEIEVHLTGKFGTGSGSSSSEIAYLSLVENSGRG